MATRLSKWRDRYEAGKTERDPIITKCKRYNDHYNAIHWDGVKTTYDEDRITINYVKAIVDTIRDSVYFQNPNFNFSGSPKYADILKVLNLVFPQILRKIGYKRQTKICVLDALKYGFAYKYNGYSFMGDKGHDAIKPDEVFSIWVPHDSVVWEHDAHGDFDANYMFYTEWKPWDFVKSDPRYQFPKGYQPTGEVPPPNNGKWRNSEGMKRVELIHVFDRGEGYHRIFVDDVKDWVFKEGWTLGENCHYFPINMLRLNDDELYPASMLRDLIPINQEINKMESMKLVHAKRFNRKYGYTGKLTDPQKKAITSGIDGVVIDELESQQALFAIQDADVNPAVYRSAESLYMIMKLISRVGEYHFGVQPKGDTTATEASYVESGTAIGTSQIKDVIGDFCERDATCLVALMEKNYDVKHIFKMSEDSEVSLDRNDLQGFETYDILVDSESAAPPVAIERKQEAIALLNMFAADPFVNSIKLRKNVLQNFKTVTNIEEWLNSEATLQVIAQSLQGGGKEFNEAAIQNYISSPNPNTDEMSQTAGEALNPQGGTPVPTQ